MRIYGLKGFSFFKWPSKPQWRQFFTILSRKEKIAFSVFLFLFISSSLFLIFNFYFKNTKIEPAKGGTYIEGVLGNPRFINPVYAASSDIDRDLTELIFSGLMKYDGAGKLTTDLAKEYKISEDGKTYEFYLKENLFWQDGEPLTADDVIFTLKAIQNPAIKSPIVINWLGINVEKISPLGIKFTLKNPSPIFLENTTIEILPEHIWKSVSEQNFPLSVYNLKPIGSGPYKVKKINQSKQGAIQSIELVANPYSNRKPNISSIIFRFFEKEEGITKAFDGKDVKGISLLSVSRYKKIDKNSSRFSEYRILMPRYFSVFFNSEKSQNLSNPDVRQALNYATDKKTLIEKVLLGRGEEVSSPFLPNFYGFKEPLIGYEYDPEIAKKLLDKTGFLQGAEPIRQKTVVKKPAFQFKSILKTGSAGEEVRQLQRCLALWPDIYPEGEITGQFGEKTKQAVIKFQEKYAGEILSPSGLQKGTGEVKQATIKKLNELCASPTEESARLSFTLITVDQQIMKDVANILKDQWKAVGVNLEVKTYDIATLEQEILKPRNYEMLLFGEVLGAIPDPFPFWHSSQKREPGLNLALYGSKNCDTLLEDARQTSNESERNGNLEKCQDILLQSAPAVFLYTPDYIYLVSKEIKGINTQAITDSSKRFSNIENWYINTKRTWK